MTPSTAPTLERSTAPSVKPPVAPELPPPARKPLPKAGSLGAWLLAARPATLPAALAPVVVGLACTYVVGPLRPLPALAAALGSLLLQIASNFANDVFDHEKGADREDRLGPARAVQKGLLSPQQMKRGLLVVLALGLVVGIYLTAVGGWPIIVLGLVSMLAAVAYTGGPYPLGYHGFGDLLVFVFFGLAAVCGTVFVQLGRVTALSLWAAVPLGALATAILVVNNLRDREGDAITGKRTLAVRLGARGVRAEYLLLVLVSYVLAAAGALVLRAPSLALPLLSVPIAASLVRKVLTTDGVKLNPLLPATAKLLLLYAVLLALGLALAPHI